MNEPRFNPQPTYTAGNRSVSASVPLMAIAEAIQKIEMLAMLAQAHEPDSGTSPRAEAIVTMNVLGTRLHSLPHWNKELKLPSGSL